MGWRFQLPSWGRKNSTYALVADMASDMFVWPSCTWSLQLWMQLPIRWGRRRCQHQSLECSHLCLQNINLMGQSQRTVVKMDLVAKKKYSKTFLRVWCRPLLFKVSWLWAQKNMCTPFLEPLSAVFLLLPVSHWLHAPSYEPPVERQPDIFLW